MSSDVEIDNGERENGGGEGVCVYVCVVSVCVCVWGGGGGSRSDGCGYKQTLASPPYIYHRYRNELGKHEIDVED